jgi:sec-independent protein translocase protein TatC
MSATQDGEAETARARSLKRPGARRTENPEARMPLMEHIRELRSRLLKAALAVTVGSIIGWFLYPYVFHFMTGPFCRLKLPEITPTIKGHCTSLYVTGIFDALFLRLKVAIATGVILSAPVWMFQLWGFVAPGLHSRERRYSYFFAGSAIPLFALGGTFAYFAMTKGLRFLLGLVPNHVIPIITIDAYLSFAFAMLLIFGLSFELPLVVVILNVSGVLTHKRFAKWRRLIIFGVFAFAAVATPSPDPISMLLLAVPCVILVELAEVFAYFNERRKARRGAVFPGLSPEEIAEYGLDEDPLAASHDSEAAGRP